jgi:hypothetical protein
LHPLGRYPINAPQVKHTRQGWLGNEGLPAPQAQDFRLVQLSSGDAQMIGDAWLWEAVQLAKGTPGLEALVRAEGKRAPAPMVVLGSQQFERPLVRGTSQGEPAVVEACLGPVEKLNQRLHQFFVGPQAVLLVVVLAPLVPLLPGLCIFHRVLEFLVEVVNIGQQVLLLITWDAVTAAPSTGSSLAKKARRADGSVSWAIARRMVRGSSAE